MIGEFTDLIISILGKFGRILNVRGKRVCFLVWLVCLLYWSVRNYNLGLKVQTVSTLISAIINIYGFIKWKKKKEVKEDDQALNLYPSGPVVFEFKPYITNDTFVLNMRKGPNPPHKD